MSKIEDLVDFLTIFLMSFRSAEEAICENIWSLNETQVWRFGRRNCEYYFVETATKLVQTVQRKLVSIEDNRRTCVAQSKQAMQKCDSIEAIG